jgi:hypothetical protein
VSYSGCPSLLHGTPIPTRGEYTDTPLTLPGSPDAEVKLPSAQLFKGPTAVATGQCGGGHFRSDSSLHKLSGGASYPPPLGRTDVEFNSVITV